VPLFYTIVVVANGCSWIDNDEKKLRKIEGGCRAMTDWHTGAIELRQAMAAQLGIGLPLLCQ
jgi:hypothetical protein